ncbi:cGMP-dependent protein kinase [Aureococcus anophagefferens]|nr:cGMP-dependent protein kinase [Aureococcus anophagefferens]
MYELVAGVPFYADDPMEVEKILSGSMSFPSHFGTSTTSSASSALPVEAPRQRQGRLRRHQEAPLLAGWEDLVTKKIKPPIEVKVADDADASNFDNYEEDKEEMPAMMKDWCPQLDD